LPYYGFGLVEKTEIARIAGITDEARMGSPKLNYNNIQI